MDKISVEDYDLLFGEVRVLKGMFIQLRDIVEGSIASNNLHSNAVKASNIKDGAITADKITALSIDASKIAVGTITSDQIEDGTIAADKIKTGTLTGLQISAGTITAGLLKTGGQAFSHNITFSSTDANTVSWTAGTLKTADGTSYSIDAGNTGNMAARTYIYLDKGVSETVLQISTSYDAPLGDEKIPIATAKNSTNNAIFQVFSGGGGVFISGGMIAAHTIVATQIAAGTITGTEITGTTLSAITANLGNITAGNIRGTRLQIGAGTNEDIYFEDSGIRLYDYGSNYLAMTKASNATLYFALAASGNVVQSSGNYLYLIAGTKTFQCRNTGVFVIPRIANAPAAIDGACALKTTTSVSSMHIYTSLLSNWYHSSNTSSGW